jgi:hypothetical protein
MGLDIYAYAEEPGTEIASNVIHHWRKHYRLCKWLEALDLEKGGQPWHEPAQGIDLMTGGDLDRLEAAIINDELPDEYGRDDRLEDDLAFVAKARAAISAGKQISILASW